MERQLPSRCEQVVAALKTIQELDGLALGEFEWIAHAGVERAVQDGELIFSQGAPPNHLMFVLSGEVTIKRRTSSPVTVFSGRTGRITGKTPFSRISAWSADGRASGDVWLLEIQESRFPELLSAIPSMTERIVRVLLDRNREYAKAEEQIGKLAALSKLAGNLAHELNNPASAARSAALALRQGTEFPEKDARYQLALQLANKSVLDSYITGLNAIRTRIASSTQAVSSLVAGDLEELLRDRLENEGFGEAWKLAPILAESGVSMVGLQEFLATVPNQLRVLALRDLLATVSQDAAIASVSRASERIFQIVTAVKDYSYMDREQLQEINVAHALDDVLMMFEPRLKSVVVRKDIPAGLPLLKGYGSELNQAFSALVENSLDAMRDSGVLTLSVNQHGETILIDIEDNGRVIPNEIRDRVFEPFFTTKPLGEGLGLGLDTVQRVVSKHFGAVAFDTSPEGTVFHVRLPIDRVGIY